MKFTKLVLILALALLTLINCGGTSTGAAATGGTETGTTEASNVDTSHISTRLALAGGTLVPLISDASSSASISAALKASVVDGSSTDWSTYVDPSNSNVLTDIFGPSNGGTAVVTRIRVLLDQFTSRVGDVFTTDASVDCTGATALSAGDTLNIAFYGSIANGTSTNRYFDCVKTESSSSGSDTSSTTTIYGVDSDGVIRIVVMSDSTSANTESPSVRGDSVTIRVVESATYAEGSSAAGTPTFIDLNFAHGSSYNGPDGSYGTADDVLFKSRSRITGTVTFDSAGTPSAGTGDFISTKYDQSPTPEGAPNIIVTKAIGRGSYGASEYSLFKVDSDVDAVSSLNRTFCIQMPATTGLPTHADESNCTALETAFAWGSTTFPFDILPAVDAAFADKAFFEGNDTDMVSNSGDNFNIPAY